MILGNLFQGINEESQRRLISLSSSEYFATETVLVKAGQDFPLFLYIVQENSHVEIHHLSEDLKLKMVTLLDCGEPCGEVAFVEKGPRSASIKVTSNSTLLKISYEVLEKWLKESTEARAVFFENLSRILIRRFVKNG